MEGRDETLCSDFPAMAAFDRLRCFVGRCRVEDEASMCVEWPWMGEEGGPMVDKEARLGFDCSDIPLGIMPTPPS